MSAEPIGKRRSPAALTWRTKQAATIDDTPTTGLGVAKPSAEHEHVSYSHKKELKVQAERGGETVPSTDAIQTFPLEDGAKVTDLGR